MPKTKTHVMPKVGSVFEKKYRGRFYKLTIVNSLGQIAYAVGGKTFKTPTAAAKVITKHEINGWMFWGIDRKFSDKKGRPRSVTVSHP